MPNDDELVDKDTGGAGSVLDLFRRDFEELSQSKEVYITVIGYESVGLAVKYGLPETGKILDAIARNNMRSVKDQYYQNLYTAIDTMIALGQGLYAKPDGVEDYLPFDPDESGEPVYFDGKLGKLIGSPENASARDIVIKLFGGSEHETMILSHCERLMRWLQNTKADVSKEYWELMVRPEV